MAKKTSIESKEEVKIRFKELKNGGKSIYLDIYVKGKRSYEFLKMYLIPGSDAAAKAQNDNIMKKARAIKAQRVIDIANGKAGIKSSGTRSKMLLVDWVGIIKERRMASGQSDRRAETYKSLLAHLHEFMGEKKVRLCDVDLDFIKSFVGYLSTAKVLKMVNGEKQLSHGAAVVYLQALKSALVEAERDGIIDDNPARRLRPAETKNMGASTGERVYLEIDEVKRMADAPCKKIDIKRAFMFACYCGLRISDIRSLTWGELVTIDDELFVRKRMQKTGEQICVSLEVAKYWLPNRNGAADNALVYDLPKREQTVSKYVKRWAAAAGIKKDVTFHTSRHTFATMLLTMGADLYATKELLGHKNIATTQIYAKLVDEKKKDAVSLLKQTMKGA